MNPSTWLRASSGHRILPVLFLQRITGWKPVPGLWLSVSIEASGIQGVLRNLGLRRGGGVNTKPEKCVECIPNPHSCSRRREMRSEVEGRLLESFRLHYGMPSQTKRGTEGQSFGSLKGSLLGESGACLVPEFIEGFSQSLRRFF